jgi:hypothetical protein
MTRQPYSIFTLPEPGLGRVQIQFQMTGTEFSINADVSPTSVKQCSRARLGFESVPMLASSVSARGFMATILHGYSLLMLVKGLQSRGLYLKLKKNGFHLHRDSDNVVSILW